MSRLIAFLFLALSLGVAHAESLGLQAKLYSPLRDAPPWNGNPAYPAESYFGGAIGVSGATAAISEREPFGNRRIRILARDGNGYWNAGQVIDPPADLNAYLQAGFGWRFSLDGERLAMALQGYQSAPLVIVFEKIAGIWQESARILAEPHIQLNGSFGQGGVALSGDTLAVGSPGAVAYALGVVHVFVRQGGSWVLQQVVSENDPYPAANFGSSLVLQGNRLIVNRPGASGVMHTSSGVYVFDRSVGVWNQQAKITVPPAGTANGGYFGMRMALDGDRLAIPDMEIRDVGGAGAQFDVVRVYERDGNGQWPLAASLDTGAVHLGNPTPLLAIALHGDRLLVGETYLSDQWAAGTAPGVRYFEHGAQGWSAARRIVPFDWGAGWNEMPLAYDYGLDFGASIAFDDTGAALIAAQLDRQERPSGMNSNPPGAVYVLTDSDGLFCDGFEADGPRCDGAPPSQP